MLTYFMDLQVITEHINDYFHCLYDINAFRSSLVEDCIGRCLDLVEGGSVYSADGGPTAGTISAGDAMAALDYIVFDKKIIDHTIITHPLCYRIQFIREHPVSDDNTISRRFLFPV